MNHIGSKLGRLMLVGILLGCAALLRLEVGLALLIIVALDAGDPAPVRQVS